MNFAPFDAAGDKPKGMPMLPSHDYFEQLLGRQEAPAGTLMPQFTVIYFTANWCGACKRLDTEALMEEIPEANWLKCDIDANSYTPGFCGVRSIPTFIVVADSQVKSTMTSNDTVKVAQWVRAEMRKAASSR